MNLRKILFALLATAAIFPATAKSDEQPRREFRGAWLHVISQPQYLQKSTYELQEYLRDQLDKLQATGMNAVIFQVRPSADALYPSELEPWSRFLTKNGAAPSPYWDPLQFMIDETHKRGMELHAWLNPYRVTSSLNEKLPASHIYHKEPWRFVQYENKSRQIYFDPGLPENRQFIEKVVMDIVNRYDVDGIHFDDYFYPYPETGKEFPDDASYAKYGQGMKRDDWRRKNVDLLIEELHKQITAAKPWIRFGISPFGIWRNKKSDPRGSETNGLQNYDALYADVLLWTEKGWIDYLMPQLYWELEHKRASYSILNQWWNDNANGRHMYIGQLCSVTMNKPDLAPSTEKSQLRTKIRLTREAENIQGNCWFPGYSITANQSGIADSLANDLQTEIALVPNYPWMSTEKPEAITGLKSTGGKLSWNVPAINGTCNDATHYVVYRLDEKQRTLDKATIVAVTYDNNYTVTQPGQYCVTALNRVNNESEPSAVVKISK